MMMLMMMLLMLMVMVVWLSIGEHAARHPEGYPALTAQCLRWSLSCRTTAGYKVATRQLRLLRATPPQSVVATGG